MTTQLELHASIDRVRLSARFPEVIVRDRDWRTIAEAYVDQLDRDAKEAETPCPDCDVVFDDRSTVIWSVVVRNGALFVWQSNDNNLSNYTRHHCKTIADLRRWCAALGCEMPKVGGGA